MPHSYDLTKLDEASFACQIRLRYAFLVLVTLDSGREPTVAATAFLRAKRPTQASLIDGQAAGTCRQSIIGHTFPKTLKNGC
jgi:hypothetical protein